MKAVIVLALIVVASAAVPSRPKAVNRINTASIPFSNGPRFVGGEKAGEREFPFAVSIQITIGGQAYHLCAGAIYDERRIITAGNCLLELLPEHLTIVAGAIDIYERPDDVQVIEAAGIKIHESYNYPEYEFNIGVVTLAEPLIFRQNVQPIRLAIPTIEASGEVQVVAWGVTSGYLFPYQQQKLSLNVVDRAVCKRDYSRIGVDITENMICASAPGRSTCDGDWGGVLIAKDEARRPYLAGVVSWILDPCAVEGYHSVFTNIAPLRSWLDKNLN